MMKILRVETQVTHEMDHPDLDAVIFSKVSGASQVDNGARSLALGR